MKIEGIATGKFKEDLKTGEHNQRFVNDFLQLNAEISIGYNPYYDMITPSGIKYECKEDSRCAQTGNVFIAYTKTTEDNTEAKLSEISLSKAHYYVFTIHTKCDILILVIDVDNLKTLLSSKTFKTARANPDYKEKYRSLGFLVKLEELENIAEKHLIVPKLKYTKELNLG